MLGNTSGKTLLPHLPYEKGARIVTDVLEFVGHRLPRIISKGSEIISKGLESKVLYARLSELDDAALGELGITRAEIPSLVAAKTGILPSRALSDEIESPPPHPAPARARPLASQAYPTLSPSWGRGLGEGGVAA